LNRGGAETWLMDVLRYRGSAPLALDVCVLRAERGAYEEEFAALGGVIHRCHLTHNLAAFSTRFRRLLRREQYDVVHSHLYYFSGFVLRAAAREGIAVRVAHNHPVEDRKRGAPARSVYTWLMRRWMCRYATHFVGPTVASLEALWGPDWGRDPRKRVIYNGIQTDRFRQDVDQAAVRAELRLPVDAKIVLNVGRFVPHKRQAFLVDIAARICPSDPRIYFVLIGAGPMAAEVQRKVQEQGLSERFRFIQGRPSIDSYWLAADVFAFPSCNEGFGIVIAEAAAAGLPVIALEIPGVSEAAAPFPTATLLLADSTAEDWAQEIAKALRRTKMDDRQRDGLLREFPFSIESSIRSLWELYNGR
jgi:glycosyltransferase EpsF